MWIKSFIEILVIWAAGLFHVVSSADQALVDYLADELVVRYEVISNFKENEAGHPRTDIAISLTNGGSAGIVDTDWEIWLCAIRLLEPEQLRADPDAIADLDHGVLLEHVDGCLHKLSFTANFTGLGQGEGLELKLQSSDWTVAKTDVMPNWYVTASGVEPRTIRSTAGESLSFVADLDSAEKWKRRTNDQYDPYTAQDRYEAYTDTPDLGYNAETIIPTPVVFKRTSSASMSIRTGDWRVVSENSQTATSAKYLADKLGVGVIDPGQIPASRYIYLSIGEIKDLEGTPVDVPEAYKLTMSVTGKYINITGTDTPGLMHAVQSLLSLEDGQGNVPDASIVDYPRYHYRGMHVDVGRNFVSKEIILTLLESMSMYKLNKFHFHLTDDEGWRLEIPGLPELTEVGSVRCHDVDERTCIASQLGSGPGSNNAGSGHYSVEEYKEILQYAQDRNIEVIPEFDMPGHGHAAIRSMEARYEALKGSDMNAATEYLLSDLDDTSLYVSIQYFRHNAINPCINSSYAFVEKLIQEVKTMHQDIQPLKIFHFGGDEVPEGAWVGSPHCQAFLGRNLTEEDPEELKAMFVRRVGELAHEESLELAGWEDGLMEGKEPFPRAEFDQQEVYAYAWNNIWEWGGGNRAYVLANYNYSVVLAHATDLYFDHPHEPDPEERGYYWASRVTDIGDTWRYTPDEIYDNIHVDRMGAPLSKEHVCANHECTELAEGKRQFVKGIQGHLWSETVRTPDQFWFMVYPRLLALAERGWHKAAWESEEEEVERKRMRDEDWGMFANTLGYKELSRLDQMQIQYRVPLPGAMFEGPELKAVSQFPGLSVQYSTDDGQTWADYKTGANIEPDTTLLLRTRSARGLRVSRSISVTSPPAAVDSAPGLSSWSTVMCCGVTFVLCAALFQGLYQ